MQIVELRSVAGSPVVMGGSAAVTGGRVATHGIAIPPLTGLGLIWMICFATLLVSIAFALLRFVPRKEL
jgi:hypothetical protein